MRGEPVRPLWFASDAAVLQRDGLRALWDEVIWLDAAPETARARGVARDAAALGGLDAAGAAHDRRYLAACRIYLAEQDPVGRASIVVAHDHPAVPRLVRPAPPP